MENILSYLTEVGVTALLVVGTVLLGVIGTKINSYLNNLKANEQFTLTHKVIEGFVILAEKELSGKPGIDKRDFVVDMTTEFLLSKGIKVNRDEILAGIEKGLSKMVDK